MGTSSDDESALPPSWSTKKRRSLKRSRLSSDSDEGERKTRSSRKRRNSSSKESDENEECRSEQLSTTHLQTPRSSERLRRKSSQTFYLPSREKVLDAMTPRGKGLDSQQKVRTLKRKLVNNFLREWVQSISVHMVAWYWFELLKMLVSA